MINVHNGNTILPFTKHNMKPVQQLLQCNNIQIGVEIGGLTQSLGFGWRRRGFLAEVVVAIDPVADAAFGKSGQLGKVGSASW